VTELVKQGLDFTVTEQRATVDWWGKVPTDQPNERSLLAPVPIEEGAHPSAALLTLTWEEVCVKDAPSTIWLTHLIDEDIAVPTRELIEGFKADPVELGDDLKHPLHHAMELKIRAQELLIEITAVLAHLLSCISEVPGLKLKAPAELISTEGPERLMLGLKGGPSAGREALNKVERVLTPLDHPVIEVKVRDVLKAEQVSLFCPERQDLSH
jgi:hypothetical protein